MTTPDPTVHQSFIAFPKLYTPVVNPDGTLAAAWQRLLIGLFNRQGGSAPSNPLAVYLQQTPGGGLPIGAYSSFDNSFLGFLTTTNPTPGPAQVQTLGSSPFIFTAGGPGTLIVASGRTEISRDGGTTYYLVSFQGGAVPVLDLDKVRVSWTGTAPVIVLLPTVF